MIRLFAFFLGVACALPASALVGNPALGAPFSSADSLAVSPGAVSGNASEEPALADSSHPSVRIRWWPERPTADRWYPVAALALPGNKVVAAETDQNRLYLMEVGSEVPRRLPSPEREPVEWTALARAPGLSFYALDGAGGVVYQYDYQGNYLGLAVDLNRVAEEEGFGDVDPAGLAVDRTGRAVITDRLGDRLLVFGPGWVPIGVWGQSGTEPGSWRRPGRVTAGRTGYLVADEGNRRVVRLDGLGNVTGVRTLMDTPLGVAAFPRGGYAVSTSQRILLLGRDLELKQTLRLRRGTGCSGRPFATRGLAVSPGGVLAAEGCSGRVLELFPPGD